MSDAIELYGFQGYSYTLQFGAPTQDPVMHIESLASKLVFPAGTQLTKVSGQSTFAVSGNTVTGALSGSTDANGYPVAAAPSLQTTLMVKSTAANAINVQSTSVVIAMAQTLVYNSGGVSLQGSPVIRWTPPADFTQYTKGLLYWSESDQPFSIQGGPLINARGIVFHGNGQLRGGGGGTIDLRNVQMWVDTANTSGNTTIILAADPDNSIGALRSAAGLIR